MQGVSYSEALERGLLKMEKRRPDEVQQIIDEPKAIIYGLRFPERDAKTDADYMRISFREDDKKWLEEQKVLTLTEKE